MLFDAAFRPSFVARLRLSPRLGRIFFKKQTSNQLNDQLVIAICDLKISLFERRVSAAAEPEKQEERTITGITRYLQEHLAEELSLSVLAEQFHLNPQYISQLFKSEIGVNFLAYLTSIRMEKAKNYCSPPLCPLRRWRSSPAMGITGCSPRCSKNPRASRPPSTAGIFRVMYT